MDVLLTILLFVPWIFVLWLANLAERQRRAGREDAAGSLKAVTYLLLILFYGTFILLGGFMHLVGILTANIPNLDATNLPTAGGLDPTILPGIGLGLWLPALIGIVLLLPWIRRLAGRLLPLDPASPVHAVALSYTSLILINLLVTLGMGIKNLANMMEQNAVQFDPLPGLWAQDIVFAFMGLVGVGWLARRGLRESLQRLAIVRPTLPQIALGVGAGLAMIPVVLGLEAGARQIGLGLDADVERLTEALLGTLLTSAPGILTLGLAAALGEETIFRGALQPRFGLLFTAILFALLHSTYGLTLSTALVFVVGLMLGVVRARTNTSTAMIFHAVYNIGLGLLSALNWLPDF